MFLSSGLNSSSPVVHSGVVYITNEASKMYAFTADSNGTLLAGYPTALPVDTHGITDVRQQNICGASSPAIAAVGEDTCLLVGCDDGRFYALDADDLTELVAGGYYDGGIQYPSFICSSPAIAYNVDQDHNRWVFITTRSDGGKLYAFKTER